LIHEKETLLLQNLRFRRNKDGLINGDISPNSEYIHSFEELDLDELDKLSLKSADLFLEDEDDSSEEEEAMMRSQKRPKLSL
jgi:hypothetical protein